MGNWGTSLYAGDFAADLRSTIRAVVRLPFDPDRLADIIGDTEPGAATDSDDEDYTTFWLVLADQFARYGLKSRRVLDTAVEIIDSGRDLDVQRRLGQRAAGLRTRSRILAALRDRLTNPQKPAARRVVGRPEPFVFDAGEALAYPTCGGRCRNPYAADLGRLKIYGPKGGKVWTQDGWGAVAIVERGRAFEYFAWYRPLVVRVGFAERPGLLVIGPAMLHAEIFSHGNLNILDGVAFPERFKNRVREAERQEILHRLFAEVMIDAVDLGFVDILMEGRIQMPG